MLFTDFNSKYYGDGLVNNYQFSWIDKAIDKMMREICYDNDMLLLSYDSPEIQINGNPATYILGWNQLKGRREFIERENNDNISIIPINSKGIDDVGELLMADNYRKRVIYFMPYRNNSEDILSEISIFYEISKKNIVKVMGGEIYYYFLSPKN